MTDTTRLEEKIARLEQITDDLSGIVATQQKDIEKLTARVRVLLQREAGRENEGSGGVFLADERPPHY